MLPSTSLLRTGAVFITCMSTVFCLCTLSDDAPGVAKCNVDLLPNFEDCGISTEQHLIGAEVAKLDEFPWMALLEYEHKFEKSRDFDCGGVLISKRYVLTAAHCVKSRDIPRIRQLVNIRLGEHTLSTNPDCVTFDKDDTICNDEPINVGIEEQIVHSNYSWTNPSKHNDIALIRLNKDVITTENIRPICLSKKPADLKLSFEGNKHSVAGWGLIDNLWTKSDKKMVLKVPVKSNAECQRAYGQSTVIIKSQICAGGEKDKDTCRGDSGGPLMFRFKDSPHSNWHVTGIVSFGPRVCGMQDVPGVYTRVNDYVEWILDNMKP